MKNEPLNSAADYGVEQNEDWAAEVVIRVYADDDVAFEREPSGWVFVANIEFGPDAKRKNAGGHKNVVLGDATPADTAKRECRGETGLDFPLEAFELIGSWHVPATRKGGAHKKFLFRVKMHESGVKMMHSFDLENEKEEPEYFTDEEFWSLVTERRFHPFHYSEMVNYRIIEPLAGNEIPW